MTTRSLTKTGNHAQSTPSICRQNSASLRNHVLAIDFSKWMTATPFSTCSRLKRASHRFQIFPRQCRPLDARDHRLVGDRVEEIKRAQIGQVAAALEKQRVGLDAVNQRGRQALRRFHARGAQILGEDRRGRAVVAAQIGEARLERRRLGW